MASQSVPRRMALIAVTATMLVSVASTQTSAAAGPAADPPLPTVNVAPSTGLADLQRVTVTASGFSAHAQVATVQCRPGALGEPDCDLGTLAYAAADAHGAFTLKRYVRRMILVGGSTIDCADAAGCILGAGNISNLKEANGVTIFFDPKIPPKVASIKVSSHTKLSDHQLVTVSGSGYAPATNVSVAQCVTQAPASPAGTKSCDGATQRYLAVGSRGAFTIANFALERRQIVFSKTGIRTVDCAAAAGTCDIEVTGLNSGSSSPAAAPLTFDPSAPAVVISAHASPSAALHDLDFVTVSGSGITPGVSATVQECAAGAPTIFSTCDFTTTRTITAGFRGEFTLTMPVRRDVVTFSSPRGATTVDCAKKAGTCVLRIQGTQSQPIKSVPVSFNPNVPAVVPAVTANPTTNLQDNQSIDVSVSGFIPGQPVQISQCSAEAASEKNLSYCDYSTNVVTTPSGAAGASTSLRVHRVIGGQNGLENCAARAGACVLVATSSGYYGGGTLSKIPFAKLTFAPSAAKGRL